MDSEAALIQSTKSPAMERRSNPRVIIGSPNFRLLDIPEAGREVGIHMRTIFDNATEHMLGCVLGRARFAAANERDSRIAG